jgi:hypothetical protein
MEKEFILYEQALELKKLGFDEPCFGYYHDKRLTGVNKWDRKDFEFHILSKKEVTATTVEIVIAPLYQQAFSFFREKYNIFPYTYTGNGNLFHYCMFIKDRDNQYHSNDLYLSNEEAELECLVKLIDIVKKQNLKN